MEKISEDLKKTLGFQEPLRMLRLPKGGVRIFNKSVNQLTSEVVQNLWHGAIVAGRWAFIPGEFGELPDLISSGYLKIHLRDHNSHLCKGGVRVRFSSDAELAQVIQYGSTLVPFISRFFQIFLIEHRELQWRKVVLLVRRARRNVFDAQWPREPRYHRIFPRSKKSIQHWN
jgi:hypothetical protein